MMNGNESWQRPKTAAQVCEGVRSAEDFGMRVRDWQHELRKVQTRAVFAQVVEEEPVLLAPLLQDDAYADAYLAAYVEWLCDRAGVLVPAWVHQAERVAQRACYDIPALWMQSLVRAPGAFRRRHVFTVPENVVTICRGRPRTSAEAKRKKNAERQKRYRARVREKLQRLQELERKGE